MSFAPIAIVGQGGVLPGALSPDELWRLVLQARVAIGPVPVGRWGIDPALVLAANAKRLAEALRLKATLDLDGGGKLAADLSALYGYVALRMTQANLNNDSAALDECVRLMEPVRSAWVAIGPDATATPSAQ